MNAWETQDKIEIPIFYYIDEETGKTVYDLEEMTNEFKNKLSELTGAYEIYEKKGQYAVYDAVNNGTIKSDYWKDCKPCEDTTPFYDNCCLVCSTINKED